MHKKMILKQFIYSFILMAWVAIPIHAQTKAIHTMFLQHTVPADGIEVAINTPLLRWPYLKGRGVNYAVQLSQDSSFTDKNLIHTEDLTGAFFNPHQILRNGTWYWRYKAEGHTWSAIQNFIVTDHSIRIVSPTTDRLLEQVPQAHPRVLLNNPSQEITKMSKQKDALSILAEADKVMTQKILTEKDAQPLVLSSDEKQNNKIQQDATVGLGNKVHKMVLTLCQAYLLTGHQAYADKAIAIATEISQWDPKGISGSRDFTDGNCMYDMALVFDTFYDQLMPEQRAKLLKAASVRAAGFYKTWVNNIESKVLSGHVWQLLLNEFFKTSIALYGHEPEATQWLTYSYELFLARAPILGGLDGGWAEGASYFQMNMETLIDIPDKIKIFTGFNFINLHPWYTQVADWLIYHVPPRSSADGFGDNTEELFGPPASYAAFAEVMADLTQNPKFTWYARQLKSNPGLDLSKEPILRWYRLTHPQTIGSTLNTDTLLWPMASISKEVGVAALHTAPDKPEQDIMVSMRSSPYGAYGHILSDQNTFNILVGGKRLFYRTGYKVAMDDPHRLGWSKHTKSQNGILINGEGQPYSAEAYGSFTRFLQGDLLAYVKGDASNAYQSTETKEDYHMKKFFRHIVLLQPGIVVIYDELESTEAAQWSWLIHNLQHMTLDSVHHSFTASTEGAKGAGKLWSSQPLSWNLTNKFDVPAVFYRNYDGMRTKKYNDDQWHLKAFNKQKTAAIRFLSVIQLNKSDAKILPFKENEMLAGITKIIVGDWEIEASVSNDLPPQLSIRSASLNTAFEAYGNDISFNKQVFQGKINNSSKLIEFKDGKIKFSERGDEPISPVR